VKVKNRKHPAMARVMDTFAQRPLLATADVEQPCRNVGSWQILLQKSVEGFREQ
jgi:hypothetical protein